MSVQPELAIVNVTPLAQVALARGELTVARRWADDAVSVALGAHLMMALVTRARVALAQNDRDQAERDAHDALTLAANLRGYLVVPDVLRVPRHTCGRRRRLTGKPPATSGPRRHFATAPARSASRSTTLPTTRRWPRCARPWATTTFEAAWTEGEALTIDEAIAYAQRGRGERKRPATGWASLTPAEINVVRLVSEGLPNKDVAARLFVSTRTVQAHLSNVYNKLGLRSRVQLAQEATRHA